MYTTKFNENSDLCIIYLGKQHMSSLDKWKAEERFPIIEQGNATGILFHGIK